ncbi:unnamed protein product [Ranitomeya imitator]|uniref:Uncharacterized protein n=1 Tax=Ranitomeya imitator TaxID=111125 RepID=A0ABN9KUR2_9NEOB|nr:unnamed protein product [Ranitomeya imitator]
MSSSRTPSVSVIILYPQCQCHYPVPPVSVSLSCTPSVSVIILYPECQCHYPVPPVSVSLSCTPSVSIIILYPKCQCHYPVPPVSVSLSCTPSECYQYRVDGKKNKQINLVTNQARHVSLEERITNLRFAYFGHIIRRQQSLEKDIMVRRIEGTRCRERLAARWLDTIKVTNEKTLVDLSRLA